MNANDPLAGGNLVLTPTEDLILEVLATRLRTGEVCWTFDRKISRKAFRHLDVLGLIWWKDDSRNNTLAGLTELGADRQLSPLHEGHIAELGYEPKPNRPNGMYAEVFAGTAGFYVRARPRPSSSGSYVAMDGCQARYNGRPEPITLLAAITLAHEVSNFGVQLPERAD